MSQSFEDEMALAREALEAFEGTPAHEPTQELCMRLAVGLRHALADTSRLEWVLRRLSGKELRRMGIVYSASCSREDLDLAMGPDSPTYFRSELEKAAAEGRALAADLKVE